MPVRPKVEAKPGGTAVDVAIDREATPSPPPRVAPAVDLNRAPDPDGEWSETLDLVVQATQIITAAQGRIADLELRNRELETRLADELLGLAARVAAAEQELTRAEARRIAAEERAERAEQRAATATTWLRRIHEHATKHLQR